MDNFPVKRILRHMAWERAKGELQSILATFIGEMDQFEALDKSIREFIEHVEGEGLEE